MFCSRTQCSDAIEARTTGPRSRVKHSTTETLCSPIKSRPYFNRKGIGVVECPNYKMRIYNILDGFIFVGKLEKVTFERQHANSNKQGIMTCVDSDKRVNLFKLRNPNDVQSGAQDT